MAEQSGAQQSVHTASSGEEAVVNDKDEERSDVPSQQQTPPASAPAPAQPSKIKQLWAKIGLTPPILMMMFKGAAPPTIAIAMYQSTAVATHYGTLGYLIAITSILGFCIMPRGKFIMTMSMNIIAIGFSASLNLLALYTVVQARANTTPLGSPLTGYNSSASAVCAIWLCVQVYFVNVLRATGPIFQFPAIIYSIFALVSMTYGVQMPTMTYAISFMKQLLEAFLTGFALAIACHFFIFPTSSRTVVMKEMTGYLMSLNGVLKSQTAYMASLESIDPIKIQQERENDASKGKKQGTALGPLTTPAALKMKSILGTTIELHTKLHGDLPSAKTEFAFGKLENHDLSQLWKLLRMIFIPVIGLSASMDLLQRTAGSVETAGMIDHEKLENLHYLMKQLHEPFAQMTGEIGAAINHILITLEFVKPPKKKKQADEENPSDQPTPGSPEFTAKYRQVVKSFDESKEKTLMAWIQDHKSTTLANDDEHTQRELFFTLYLEYLLWRTSVAVLEVVQYADELKLSKRKSKLIFPGSKTLYKWLKSTFARGDHSQESLFTTDIDSGNTESVFLGDEFSKKLDPEHQPPRTATERIGESIRLIPKFFRSDASSFGFRTVCATMTIAIVCFLESTQTFFLEQRLLWAMIMVAISMNRTAGQSIWNFVLRVCGTAIAMIGSFIVWYIVDGNTAGVIVFMFLWIAGAFYFVMKYPKFVIVAIISLVTVVLVIGYELQVRKIGVAASTSNGQPAYPTYLLAPYRLATVAGGLAVAFIWTIFPFPISESSELRKDLAASLYLLSNFYSIVHETLRSRIQGTDGDVKVKGTHAYHLEKARNQLFQKLMMLLTNLKSNAGFSRFALSIGGHVPREEYEGLIEGCERTLRNITLISYASATFSLHGRDEEQSQWSNDFRKLLVSINSTSHQITHILMLLSSSLSNGQPLPPYLEMPKAFHFVKKLEAIDADMLSIRHIAEPEYSAFAVVTICAAAVNDDVAKLTKHVKALVGEVDFSFHAIKSSNASAGTSHESDDEKNKFD